MTLKGDIQNNILSSPTTVSGKIIEMKKQQGEAVKKGDVIAVIDNINQKYIVDQFQAVVNMKKAKLEELQSRTQIGNANYIALKHEYTPKYKQSTSDSKHTATKIKVAINDPDGKLKSGMYADVEVPIK